MVQYRTEKKSRTMKINIAIDLTQIPANKTGIGMTAVYLVKELLLFDPELTHIHFVFFAQDDDPLWPSLISNSNHCQLVLIKSKTFRKLPCRFFFEQFLLPHACKKMNIHAIYSFHYTIPYLTRIKRIVTIPDMTFYLFPHLHQLIKRIYFRFFIPLSLKKSFTIITVSHSTKKDLLNHFPKLDPNRIQVMHLGVEPPALDLINDTLLPGFGLESKRYLLYVGTLEPRKNIEGMIKAFHQVVHSNIENEKKLKLVIAGKKGWFYQGIFQTVKKLHLEEQVIFTGYVDEPVKQTLLKNAYLFVYPSFYEGFGLPLLEAMVYSVPVITSNVSSLPEVAGDAGLLVNPGNWEEIATAMTRLLTDNDLYMQLSGKSRQQAALFSWKKFTQKTMELFSQCITPHETTGQNQ